jgi:hypothetical protein
MEITVINKNFTVTKGDMFQLCYVAISRHVLYPDRINWRSAGDVVP